MIRGNLATVPFEAARSVRGLLALGAVIAVGATIFNLFSIATYWRADRELRREAGASEQRAAQLRRDAGRARETVTPAQIQQLSVRSQAANALIDRRVFSWTELLNQLERTQPPDVRLISIRPRTRDRGGVVLEVAVLARSVSSIDTFLRSLEDSDLFRDTLSRDERVNEQGETEASIEMTYTPPARN